MEFWEIYVNNVLNILFWWGILGSCIGGWWFKDFGVFMDGCIILVFFECMKVFVIGLVMFILLLGDIIFVDDCVI